ncbi:helix-turn-helix transcriptional regulator [Planctomicrobium sp. SH661]|uniref:helix-turn-helix transcriptional regulator n=1 Tax=Planctomicrobium sp. SH661 TaxID=3448124 RepID=UPI003F5AEAAC
MFDSHSQQDSADQGEYPRLTRLLNLVQLLDNGLQRNAGELAEVLGVSRRTVFRDLKTMQSCGVQVEFNEHTKKYRMMRQSKIPSAPVKSDVLSVAAALLTSQLNSEMKRAVAFLEVAFAQQLGESKELEAFEAAMEFLKDERESPSQQVPWPLIQVLFQGYLERSKVRISFTHDRQESTLLSPYRFVLGDEGWEVSGWSSLHRSRIRVKAELITSAELTEFKFALPSD